MRSFLIWIRPFIHVLGVVLALGAVTSAKTREALALQFGSSTALVMKLLIVSLLCSVAALSMALVSGSRKLLRRFTGADIRILLYVMAAGLVLQFAYFQPYSSRLFKTALALTLGGYAIVMLIQPILAPRLPARLVALVNVVLMNVLIFALLAEVSLRIIAVVVPLPIFQQGDESAAQMIRRYRLQPGEVRWGFAVNSRGDYDEEPGVRRAGQPLVISIGDSFSAGIVPHKDHFTTVAERVLGGGVDLYNAGVPGIGPPEYLYLMQTEALPRQPDVLLVNLFIGNDLDSYRSPHFASILLDRSNLLIFQVPRRMFRIRRGLASGAETIGPPSQGEVVGQVERPQGGLSHAESTVESPGLATLAKELSSFRLAEFMRVERERAAAVCAEGRDVDVRYTGLWAEILKLKAAAGNIPILFMLIPDEFQVEDALWNEVAASIQRPLTRDQPQERITAFLRQEGIPSLDLLPALRAIPRQADGNRHLYHPQDTHFNGRGNQVAGEKLAEFLRPYLKAKD